MNIEEATDNVKFVIGDLKASNYNKTFIEAIETILTAYEKEKEKNEELENKINHKYKKVCPECKNWFIAKRSDAKYCQKCSKKVAHRKYRETNRAKINEYSKLHMREYRVKKKLLKEE